MMGSNFRVLPKAHNPEKGSRVCGLYMEGLHEKVHQKACCNLDIPSDDKTNRIQL